VKGEKIKNDKHIRKMDNARKKNTRKRTHGNPKMNLTIPTITTLDLITGLIITYLIIWVTIKYYRVDFK